jgi:hypothetical protein
MSLLGSITGMMTSGVDLFVGGQLTKAVLEVDKDDDRAEYRKLEFQFNPETIKINRAQPGTRTPVQGKGDVQEQQNAAPLNESTMVLSNMIFDTYEEKPFGSVYEKYIEALEHMAGVDPEKHAPPYLVFTWGRFSQSFKNNRQLKCKLDNLDVEYTMFLNDGTPVRAKVNMTLKLGLKAEDQEKFQSPDHAKLVTVKRGDTLADIASIEYDNPAEWRRIANANNIDDPMSLTPGTKLIVPPILS